MTLYSHRSTQLVNAAFHPSILICTLLYFSTQLNSSLLEIGSHEG